MSEKLVEKVIGGTYIAHNDKIFVVDVYEGNYYKLVEGGTLKTISLSKREYDRLMEQYQECVRKDIMITSAYEMNKRANYSYDIPAVSADPEAAEKEWYLRKHPQVVVVEETKKRKSSLFSQKKKNKVQIKCLECGAINPEGQKFCGDCGTKLLSAEDELLPESHSRYEDLKTSNTEGSRKVPVSAPLDQRSETIGTDIIDLSQPDEDYLDDDDYNDPYPQYSTGNTSPDIESRPQKSADSFPEHTAEKNSNKKPMKEQSINQTDSKPRKARRRKKRGGTVFVIILLFMFLFIGGAAAIYILMYGGGIDVIYNSNHPQQTVQEVITPSPEPIATPSEAPVTESHVVVKIKNDILTNQQITESDIEGTILNDEQFEKYNGVSTHIDAKGQVTKELLILWEDRDTVIGKYAARDLTAGSILYDTAVTSQHVVAAKTYVDIDVNGESKTYESNTDILPGNTRIQIVAIVQTDSSTPKQILLSEMTLQDRSLESIFDSAGKDILDLLSGTPAQEDDTEEETNNILETGEKDETEESQ